MKVNELIEVLKKLDQEQQIMITGADGHDTEYYAEDNIHVGKLKDCKTTYLRQDGTKDTYKYIQFCEDEENSYVITGSKVEHTVEDQRKK